MGLASAGSAVAQLPPMAQGENGWTVSDPLFTVGETFNKGTPDEYTPPGILDGLGAYRLNRDTVRVLANHELPNSFGYEYFVNDGKGGTFGLKGARVSYFDIDRYTREIVDAGLAYDTIYDGNRKIAEDNTFLTAGFIGFSRFCSSVLVEPGQFNYMYKRWKGGDDQDDKYCKDDEYERSYPSLYRRRFGGFNRGLEDRIYFTGEEDGGFFNPVGGAEWALDTRTGDFWQVPAMGRGAWENVSPVDTGDRRRVAFILADDSSPFDFDGDETDEVAPLYLYIGYKKRSGKFLERNGLAKGRLYVWVSDTGETLPSQFNTSGTLYGKWIEVDNTPMPDLAKDADDDDFDRNGYDEYGYPTQGNLWLQAEALGAFGFSRPEDVAVNPDQPNQVVLASTGVDTYDVDPVSGNGADTFGTMCLITTDFDSLVAELSIIYDGDADPGRTLRSPDNLDWAKSGYVLVQEDEAEEDTLSGDEVLFGADAANPNEAGIVLLDPYSGATLRVANIDRNVVLDASIADPLAAVDVDADPNGLPNGEWESSGILDVSHLFGEYPGSLFLFDVQAHGIEDQDQFNSNSRIVDGDLVEGGQLLFLKERDM
jgi:hypothetical protein